MEQLAGAAAAHNREADAGAWSRWMSPAAGLRTARFGADWFRGGVEEKTSTDEDISIVLDCVIGGVECRG